MDRNLDGKRKRSDATGSRHRRWLYSLALVVTLGLAFVPVLQAVHDFAFELDGNVIVDNVSPTPYDWVSIFDANGDKKNPLPTGFSAAAFTKDFVNNGTSFVTSDATTFATGSKDTLPISTGWQCNADSNVNSKIDIVNAYAAAYKDPTSGDDVIYFSLERNANTGDANVGFWFLQDAVNCNSNGGTGSFTGNHLDGDLLIVSAFTNGGTVSTIDVYRWDRPGNPAGVPGAINPTPVAHGVDCRSNTTPAGDPACAAANTTSITVPWLTAAKSLNPNVGHTLPTAQFFEGGLNLTDSGLAGKCFNVFIGDTRSSQSLTATLFDYAEGQIGECSSTTVTTPKKDGSNISGAITIPASGVIANLTDSAAITVNGVQSFDGHVAFHLCGPFDVLSTTLCTTGGVDAGTKAITANGSVSSNSMTVTEVGRYCWRAEFTATDEGIPDSSDSAASECFSVAPLTAVLVTTAGAGPVDFGQPVTDTATLTNTANHQGSAGPTGSTDGSINPTVAGGAAGGTIKFFLYGPSTTGCGTLATGFPTTGISVTVSGNNTYGGASSTPPVSFTPQAPGTYHWKAEYTGDSPNTVGTEHNSACDDTTEDVVVRTIPTEIKTKQNFIPNDTATVSTNTGNLAAGGKVAFSLYLTADCSGAALYSEEKTLTGGSPTEEVSTANTGAVGTGFRIQTAYTDPADSTAPSTGVYSWKVVYTPASGDTAHTGKQSSCSAEHFSITYTNDPGPGTNLP